MELIRAKKLSQITLLLAITGTRMNSLNNISKTVLRVQHVAESLRTFQLTEERLNIIIGNT